MYRNLRFIYITAPNREEAKEIGRALVEEQLAACVNIIDGMESIYRWKGEIEEAKECVLIVKTHYSRVRKFTRRVKEMHSYACPCIVSFTLTESEGNMDYLNWIENNSRQLPGENILSNGV